MLNVGPLELLVVLAVALIVVGPERLPELARSVGRALRQLRQVQDEVRDMVTAGVDDEVRQAATDFKKATGDIAKSSGVGELGRKSGRAAGPRKAAPGGRRTTPTTRGESTATRTGSAAAAETDTETAVTGTEADPVAPMREAAAVERESPVDAEVAGPPADRLVEDAASSSEAHTRETGDAEEPAADR